jgi:hypothetical protein
MGNSNSTNDDDPAARATLAERKLRGKGLDGADQKEAVDHLDYKEKRDPDTELRLDGEPDTLYDDGLEVDEDPDEPPAGTRGDSFGIKP